jgi:hypothetical protein
MVDIPRRKYLTACSLAEKFLPVSFSLSEVFRYLKGAVSRTMLRSRAWREDIKAIWRTVIPNPFICPSLEGIKMLFHP